MISVKKDINTIPSILLSAAENKEAWRDPSVLETLKVIYHGKCGYCETKTENLDVGHYRPRNKYKWLANEWSNLLPVCEDCKKAKSDHFPINGLKVEDPNDSSKNKANSKYLLSEQPVLIHPEVDTVENHFYFDTDGTIQGHTERGRKTIGQLNLNRDSLRRERFERYLYFLGRTKDKIIDISKHKDLLEEFFLSTNEEMEFSLLGKQVYFQFEEFIFNRAVSEVEELNGSKDENGYFVPGLGQASTWYSELILKNYYNHILGYEYSDKPELNIEMPLNIAGFTIKEFQGIKDLTLNNIPINSQWIFITGDNGFGKTSLLKAILLGLIGKSEFKPTDIDQNVRVELKTAELRHFWLVGGLEEKVHYNILGSESFTNYGDQIAAYGVKRTDLDTKASKLPISNNLFGKSSDVLNTEKLLETLNGEELEPFKNIIIESFKTLIPKLSRIEFLPDENKTSKETWYYEKDDNGNELPPVKFDDLAMGMRSIIGFVGDMIQRLSKHKTFISNHDRELLNPYIEKFKTLSDLSGIVIVDEFDNHLHPKWQKMLVEKLTKMFPKVQFIVSTHSAIPLLGAPKNSVIINVQRTKEKGITAEKLDIDFSRLTPNSIFTSPIFGFEDINSDEVDIDEVETPDLYSNIEKTRSMELKLNVLKQTDEDFFNSLMSSVNE